MRLTIDLDPALLARAEAEAARERATLSQLIGRLVEQGLATRPDPPASGARPPAAPSGWVVTYGGQPRLGGIDWTSNVSIYEAAELEYDLRQAGVLPFEDPDESSRPAG